MAITKPVAVNEHVDVTAELQNEVKNINDKKGHLSKEDEDRLIVISQKTNGLLGDDVMFLKHYSSIEKICAAFADAHHTKQDKDDYINDCYESLKEAMQNFRFNAGVRFNTYLSIIIKRDLNDNYYKSKPCSKYYQQQYYLIEQFRKEYIMNNGYEPAEKEVCDALGYTTERYHTIQREAMKCFPLYFDEISSKNDVDLYDNDGVTAVDEIYLDSSLRVESPEDILISKETNVELAQFLHDLGTEYADVICRVAGYGKYTKPQSKAQIMRETGLSKQKLNKVYNQILVYAQSRLATVR